MEGFTEPARNERITEERKKSAENEFSRAPSRQLAEWMLGNVPNWVYSYPQKDNYLWRLTVLEGVTAGLAADYLMKYLAVWEQNASEILDGIEREFKDKIEKIRQRGEAASTLPEILSASRDLEQISREEIPAEIWKGIVSKLDAS
jgi:hypothetical protein